MVATLRSYFGGVVVLLYVFVDLVLGVLVERFVGFW